MTRFVWVITCPFFFPTVLVGELERIDYLENWT